MIQNIRSGLREHEEESTRLGEVMRKLLDARPATKKTIEEPKSSPLFKKEP